MIFRRFPYTTINDINLDWIIKQVKQLVASVQGKQDKPESAGTAGQVLGLDSNLEPVWVYQSALPAGGSENDFLKKNSNADYDTEWASLYSSETPLMDSGNGDPGLSTLLSRRDHRHPSDTSKQDKPESPGTAGQVLGLDNSLNPVWVDQTVLPAGGTANEFLRKNSSADYDAGWVSLYSSETPLMDSGNGDPGLSTLLSRRDHRHPSDTSKLDKPATTGTAGQVLGLDSSLNPVWVNQSGGGGLPAGGSANEFLMKSSSADYDARWTVLYSSETPLMDSGNGDPGLSTLLSRRDHRHPTDTTRQETINASGILKGAGSGSVQAATKGVDYGGLAFTVILFNDEWVNGEQIKMNNSFLASGYAYIVTPASNNITVYTNSQIHADNVTTDMRMTFHCTTVPTTNITVNILRVVSA